MKHNRQISRDGKLGILLN